MCAYAWEADGLIRSICCNFSGDLTRGLSVRDSQRSDCHCSNDTSCRERRRFSYYSILQYKVAPQCMSLICVLLFVRESWWCSSGFSRRVDSHLDTNVSEKHTVSIFRAEVRSVLWLANPRGLIHLLSLYKPSASNTPHFSSEDVGSMFLRNVGICLQIYTALQPRRLISTFFFLAFYLKADIDSAFETSYVYKVCMLSRQWTPSEVNSPITILD
jgi:hypothetical protein